MAHGPSVPRGRMSGLARDGHRLATAVSGPRNQRPSQRAPGPEPSESLHSSALHHRPSAAFTASRARARPSALHRAAGSARGRSRPRPAPPPLGASSTGPQVGLGAGEARWRRSEEFITQSPGCRQGTILAPVAAWQQLPGSGAVWALGRFGSTTRPHGRGGESRLRRDERACDHVTLEREPTTSTGCERACSARGGFGPSRPGPRLRSYKRAGATSALAITLRSNESRPLALAASERAQREVGSGRAGQARAFGRTSERAFRKRATPAERAEASVSCASDSGGASGSGPGRRPGGSARDDLPRRSRQARSRSRPAGVTAPGHGGHGATHGFHGAGHSEHGDGEQPAGPVCAAASAAGAAAFTIPYQGLEVENPTNHPTPATLPWVRGANVRRGGMVQGEHGVRVY